MSKIEVGYGEVGLANAELLGISSSVAGSGTRQGAKVCKSGAHESRVSAIRIEASIDALQSDDYFLCWNGGNNGTRLVQIDLTRCNCDICR